MQYIESLILTQTFDEFEVAVRRDMVQEDAAPMQGLAQDGDTHDHSLPPGLKPKSKAARKPKTQTYSRMVGKMRTTMASLRRRGKANCTVKPHSEMSITDYLEHAAKSKIMAE